MQRWEWEIRESSLAALADLSGCGWPPLGKLGLRSGLLIYSRPWHVLLMSSRQPSPMWGLGATHLFPSTQKDRVNVLEPCTPQQTPLPHSFKTLSISPGSPCFFFISEPLYLSPPLSASLLPRSFLAHIRTSFPIFPSSRLLLSLIPLCCCFPVLQSFFLT